MGDKHSLNKKTINEQPMSLKNDHILYTRINSDEVRTKIEDYHYGEVCNTFIL